MIPFLDMLSKIAYILCKLLIYITNQIILYDLLGVEVLEALPEEVAEEGVAVEVVVK